VVLSFSKSSLITGKIKRTPQECGADQKISERIKFYIISIAFTKAVV
jgi:hypothetical protein